MQQRRRKDDGVVYKEGIASDQLAVSICIEKGDRFTASTTWTNPESEAADAILLNK